MEEFTPSFENRIYQFLNRADYVPMKKHELMSALGIREEDRATFRHILYEMEVQGKIILLRKNRWALPQSARQTVGRLRMHPQGFGFVISDDPAISDIFIPEKSLGTALEGDRVQAHYSISTEKRRKKGGPGRQILEPRLEGTILRVLSRGYDQLVGLLTKNPYYWYMIPDNPRFLHAVKVRHTAIPLVEDHKVVMKLDPWESVDKALTGEVIEDLGASGARGVDVLSVMRQYRLDSDFPEESEKEARKVSELLAPADLKGRKDLREQVIFTIDPEDAKDFDDAVSLQELPDQRFLLGVHIADVSHFVQQGTALDKEAYLRGTSVYMVDRTVTMLPPFLTTEVCSLQPEKDRLTHSAEILLDAEGQVLEASTFPSVIRSCKRLHYDQVQQFFDHGEGTNIPEPVRKVLGQMRPLARRLRKKRIAEGSMEVDLPEIKCVLDMEGKPLSFHRRGASEAYHLIEEFMLLANQAVARKMAVSGRPALYRIHDAPDDEQWERMALELSALNIKATPHSSQDINR
ncbi:MAG: RNB domain-containing ribonuclease, partial [Lentisphaerota bacterium]